MDNLHKVSHKLVTDYDIIALEDLNVKGMVKNHKLAKHISDASWGNFEVGIQSWKTNKLKSIAGIPVQKPASAVG